jgi:UDP-N-acetylglucosamine 2-epimerase
MNIYIYIASIVGARPNFIKLAPVSKEFSFIQNDLYLFRRHFEVRVVDSILSIY